MHLPAIFISLLLSFCAVSIAAAKESGDAAEKKSQQQAALTYIDRLAKGKLDITKHTALSEHCSDQRRKVLNERIDFQGNHNFRKGDIFSIESVKTDQHLGGVLIKTENPSAPLSTRIHPVALIKKGGVWKAAPLPGIFSNTGYGYDEKVEQSVRSLEQWMSTEKKRRESRYRATATQTFKSKLVAIEAETDYSQMIPEQAVMHMLKQCRKKDVLSTLASMGAASDALEEPLKITLDIVIRGLQKEQVGTDWDLVSNKAVIAHALSIDNTRNEVAVGFFNPNDRDTPKILYFPFHQAGEKTFAQLSPMLKVALLPKGEQWQQRWRHRRNDELELRKKLPATIFKNITPVSHPTKQKLLDHFLSAIEENDFSKCLALLPRKGEYFSKQENQTTLLSNAASLWRDMSKLSFSAHKVLAPIEEKELALIPLQFAKKNKTGEFVTIKLWMTKDKDGWHLLSPETLSEPIGDDLKSMAATIEKHFLSQEKQRQEELARNLLSEVVKITLPLKLNAVAEQEAAELFTKYRAQLRTKSSQSALSYCAVLKGTENAQIIKAMNYALRGASDHLDDDQTMGVTTKGPWTGLSARTESKLTGLHDYPLYLIVNTEQGPRILLDIDLRHPTNKGRALINKKHWKNLEQVIPKASLTNIKSIFNAHTKLTLSDVEKMKKLHE